MTESGFLLPWALSGLIAILVLRRLLASIEHSIISLHNQIGWRDPLAHSRIAVPLALITLIILAVARPFAGKETLTVEGRGRELFIAVDVSLSMLTKDVAPSRIEFAKRKAQDIVNYLREFSPENRIGLILYSGDAYVYCPLTPDSLVVSEYTRNIAPGLISTRGSSLWRVFEVAEEAIKDSRAVDPQLIVLGDGEDLSTGAAPLAEKIRGLDFPVLFLGIGTPEGQPIPLDEGGYLSSKGEIVISKLDETLLGNLFDSKEHLYRRATLSDGDFSDFLSAHSRIAAIADEAGAQREITTYGELGPALLIATLIVTLIVTSTGSGRRILFSLIFLLPLTAHADDNPFNDSKTHEAFFHYQTGDYRGAYERYAEAAKANPSDPIALQGLGSSAFKLEKFAEAQNSFQQMELAARKDRHRFDAAYNLGNSFLAEKKYREAISAYNRALAIQPTDVPALNNRAIAEALLKQEEEKKEQKKSEQNSQQDSEQTDNSSSGESQNAEKQENESNSPDEKSQSSQEDRAHDQKTTEAPPENTQQPNDQSESKEKKSQPGDGGSTNEANPEASPSAAAETTRPAGQSTSEADAQKESTEEKDHPVSEESNPSISASPSPAPGQKYGNQESIPGASSNARTAQPLDTRPLSERQAAEWLKGLPEAPILIQRLNRRAPTNPGGQSW